jgi:hypothetical protein
MCGVCDALILRMYREAVSVHDDEAGGVVFFDIPRRREAAPFYWHLTPFF